MDSVRKMEDGRSMRLADKVALISGGARGIGAAQARLFAREGAKVVVGDILEEEGHSLVQEIRRSGGTALFVKLDVTKQEDWSQAVEAAGSFGKINVLVNNAGISGSQWGSELVPEAWHAIMEVNATGVFLGTRAVLPGDEGRRRRVHHQYIVADGDSGFQLNASCLQRFQGGGQDFYEIHCRPVRPGKHQVQLNTPRDPSTLPWPTPSLTIPRSLNGSTP